MVAGPAKIATWRKVVMAAYMLFAVLLIAVGLRDGPQILALTGLCHVGVAIGLLDARRRWTRADYFGTYFATAMALLVAVAVGTILMASGLELTAALYIGGVLLAVLLDGYVVATLIRAFRRHEIAW